MRSQTTARRNGSQLPRGEQPLEAAAGARRAIPRDARSGYHGARRRTGSVAGSDQAARRGRPSRGRCQMAAKFGAREVARLESVYASARDRELSARARARRSRRGPASAASTSDAGRRFLAVELGREVGPDGHIVGVDESPEMLEAARARIAREGLADRVEVRARRRDPARPSRPRPSTSSPRFRSTSTSATSAGALGGSRAGAPARRPPGGRRHRLGLLRVAHLRPRPASPGDGSARPRTSSSRIFRRACRGSSPAPVSISRTPRRSRCSSSPAGRTPSAAG